jgi:hypothetical protein
MNENPGKSILEIDINKTLVDIFLLAIYKFAAAPI